MAVRSIELRVTLLFDINVFYTKEVCDNLTLNETSFIISFLRMHLKGDVVGFSEYIKRNTLGINPEFVNLVLMHWLENYAERNLQLVNTELTSTSILSPYSEIINIEAADRVGEIAFIIRDTLH